MSPAYLPPPLFALLGDPVHHSLSPSIHNAAFEASGLDGVYVALRTRAELVGPLMRRLGRIGGGGNVTVPHKRRAAEALHHTTPVVTSTGACNVFWWEPARGLCGDNTDAAAFAVAAERLIGSLGGRRVLLLGAGGAARAVVHACMERGVALVDILNRTRPRAEEIQATQGSAGKIGLLEAADDLRGREYDLAVNATSLGLRSEDPLPVPVERLRADALLDLVYGRDETRLVRVARSHGLLAEDGRRMLAEQAALSFERWSTGPAPRELVYRAVGLDWRSP